MADGEAANGLEWARCLRAATRVAAGIAERASVDAVAKTIARALVSELGASGARVWLLAENGASSELAATVGEHAAAGPSTRVSLPLGAGGERHGVAVACFRAPPPDGLAAALDALGAIAAATIHHAKALAASERRYRFVVDSIPQLVWTAGADGAADFFSARFVSYTGASIDALRGDGWLSWVSGSPTRLATASHSRPSSSCGRRPENTAGSSFTTSRCTKRRRPPTSIRSILARGA